MRSLSIRARLTLWYTLILAVVIVVFAVALYSLLTLTLLNSIDSQLEATAARIMNSSSVRLSIFAMETVIQVPELDILASPGLYIQVYDPDSGESRRSQTLGEAALPLEDEVLDLTMNGSTDLRTVEVGGTKLRIFSAPLTFDSQVEGVVQVGTSLAQVDQTQGQLLGILVAGGVVAIAAATILGALLARAALRPIDQITQTALTISRTEDLSRRLDVQGPSDEVGRLAATFDEMLARLEVLFRTQQRFVADVSHDLRTPLTTIQGNIDLLRRGAAEDPEVHQEVLGDIEAEVSRMSRLVSDLLLLARVDAGVRLECKPVELDTLLLQVYRQSRLMSNGVDVRLGHEDQAVVLGDADRLQQLLLNLVDNALKYTAPGGQVTLSLYNEGEWVRIEVQDTGIGIAAADLEPGSSGVPRIFERFYRADPARSQSRGGSGLGLSIAHWIAQAHGGRLTVESEPGQGSTFTLMLPAQS